MKIQPWGLYIKIVRETFTSYFLNHTLSLIQNKVEKTTQRLQRLNLINNIYECLLIRTFQMKRFQNICFNPNQPLESLSDFVGLLGRCADVSSKAYRATARCNGCTDVGKRTKAVREQASNNKSKQMHSNDPLWFNFALASGIHPKAANG